MSEPEKSSSNLLNLWHRALKASVGIKIITSDRVLLRQQLYKARAEAQDPELEMVVILFPIKDDEIQMVRKDIDANPS